MVLNARPDQSQKHGYSHAYSRAKRPEVISVYIHPNRYKNIADMIPIRDTCWRVRGMENMKAIRAVMIWNTTVHWEWSDKVLRILLPVKTWKPIRKTLFKLNTKSKLDCIVGKLSQ